MAQIYTWDRQGFEDSYWKYYYKMRGCGASAPRSCKCHDSYVTYSRVFFETNDMFKERATRIVSKLSLPQGSSVLVVGCALGYLMEEFLVARMVPYGFDNSSYIRGAKNQEKVKFEIPSIDITDNNVKTLVNRAFGVSEFDCVVTEDVLPSHDSYDKIISNCESLLKSGTPKNRVVHIVQVNAPSPFITKSLEEWKTINADHTWLDQNGAG